MFRAIRYMAIFALIDLLLITKYLSFYFKEYAGIFARTPLKDALTVLGLILFLSYYKMNLVDFSLGISYEGFPKEATELLQIIRPNFRPSFTIITMWADF